MKKKKILTKLDEIFSDLMHLDHPVPEPANAIRYKTCICHLCSALAGVYELKSELLQDVLKKVKEIDSGKGK